MADTLGAEAADELAISSVVATASRASIPPLAVGDARPEEEEEEPVLGGDAGDDKADGEDDPMEDISGSFLDGLPDLSQNAI